MIKRIKEMFHFLFDRQLELQDRMVRIVLASAFIASIIGMGRVWLGADSDVMIALVPMCAVSGGALWLAVKQHKIREASWLLILADNVVLFPLVFILSSGTDSGTPVWFVLGLVYTFLLFQGKDFFMALFLSMAAFFGTYYLAFLVPGVMPPAPGRF